VALNLEIGVLEETSQQRLSITQLKLCDMEGAGELGISTGSWKDSHLQMKPKSRMKLVWSKNKSHALSWLDENGEGKFLRRLHRHLIWVVKSQPVPGLMLITSRLGGS
jgi:hypothetical protein